MKHDPFITSEAQLAFTELEILIVVLVPVQFELNAMKTVGKLD